MRRQTRPARNIDRSITSPCVQVCQFKKDELVCKGCYRSQDEVRHWMIMSKDEKLACLAKVDIRRTEKN